MKKLGPWLVERGVLTEAQLADAQRQDGAQFLGTALLSRGVVPAEWLLPALADYYKIPWVRLSDAAVDRRALEQVPMKVALHYKVLPLRVADSTLTVAIANPQDVRALDDFRLALRQRYTIEPVLSTEEETERAHVLRIGDRHGQRGTTQAQRQHLVVHRHLHRHLLQRLAVHCHCR